MYALVEFLDFVDVLFQSGIFDYVRFHGGVLRFMCGGGSFAACFVYLQNVFVYAEQAFSRAKNEGARGVWEFQRPPSRLLSSMDESIIVPEDTHAITILDNY